LYNSTGFFFLCWAAHYFPFYTMGRQLFLHHYLPAHLASCLVTGALVEFVFNVEPNVELEPIRSPTLTKAKEYVPAAVQEKAAIVAEKSRRKFQTAKERMKGQSLLATWLATIVILAIVIAGFAFFFPLTYGWPGLSVEAVNRRKWLGYDLHFAK
jgi:dolichyl-phosphate-mannose-protein mannosyltransferase